LIQRRRVFQIDISNTFSLISQSKPVQEMRTIVMRTINVVSSS
jgi:hypothetical protein